MTDRISSFAAFWPYYLSQHLHPTCRRLHFIGTTCSMLFLVAAVVTRSWPWLALVPVAGYGFAWVGHFFIEKNRPATFTYPGWSLMGDFVMYWKTLTGTLDADLRVAADLHR